MNSQTPSLWSGLHAPTQLSDCVQNGRGFACTREIGSLVHVTLPVAAWLWGGWCREWYVAVWRCVAGAAPVWHVVAGDWRCVAGAAPVWHLVAGDWSILVALERLWVRCSVTLRGRRSTSVTFGGRRLGHLVALERGSGWLVQGMVRCSVTVRGRQQQCDICWQVIEAACPPNAPVPNLKSPSPKPKGP